MKANAAAKQASAAAKSAAAASAGKTGPGASGAAAGNEEDDQDDDEEGRVSMVGKKNKKRRVDQDRTVSGGTPVPASAERNVEDAAEKTENGTVETEGAVKAKPAPAKGRKKATSYLDELLAERSKKRKKR